MGCTPSLPYMAALGALHEFYSLQCGGSRMAAGGGEAPLLTLKKKLRCVACLLLAISRDGFTLARSLELDRQWACIIRSGPVGCLDWASLEDSPRFGLVGFQSRVNDAIDTLTEFVKRVVISRRDSAVRGWRSWILEDPLVHPYRWLRPDLVPLAPFLVCDPEVTFCESGILVEPHATDEPFRRAWMPFFL